MANEIANLENEVINLENVRNTNNIKIEENEKKIVSLMELNQKMEEDLQLTNKVLESERETNQLMNEENDRLKEYLQCTEKKLYDIENSLTWRVFKPIRLIVKIIKERKENV